MVYSIELSKEDEDLLQNRAVNAGRSPVDLIIDAIRHENHRTNRLEQRRTELAENFRELSITDEPLADELEEIKHQMRAQRRERAAR